MAGEIVLNATLHRPVYQAMPTPQQAYLLLEVTAADPSSAGAGRTQPVNLCLALDRSGSMAGEKLRFVKEAAALVVDQLGPEDLLSIVIFDDVDPAQVVWPSGPVAQRDRVQTKIQAILERGGTHMSTGMRQGLQELRKGQTPQRVSSLLLLTDGQTWEDEDECRRLAEQSRAAGIPICVLGLGVGAGSDWDPRLLEDLARLSGGEWQAIDTPGQVVKSFEKFLQGMQRAVATNAQLTLRMAQGVAPRNVWRVTPLISQLAQQEVSSAYDVQVFLGEIQAEIGQSILLDLLFPVRAAGNHRLLQVDVTYDVPGGSTGKGLVGEKATLDVVVPFTDDPLAADQTDSRMMNIVERVVAHKLQTQALDEALMGDVVKATQRLRAAATRLLELGEVDMALQANQQAQQIEQKGHVDMASAQKMRYATKRLTEIDRG